MRGSRGGRERQAVSREGVTGTADDGSPTKRKSRARRVFAIRGERRGCRITLRECLNARRHGDRLTRTRANRVGVSRERRLFYCRAHPAAPSVRLRTKLNRRVPDHHQQNDPERDCVSGSVADGNRLAKRQIFFLNVEDASLIALRASVAVRARSPVAMASRSALRRGIASFAEATRGVAAGNALARQSGVTASRYDAPA